MNAAKGSGEALFGPFGKPPALAVAENQTDRAIAALAVAENQTDRAIAALEIMAKMRDEIRAERDAAVAEVSRLREILDRARFITVEELNALPEAAGWWPSSTAQSGKIVKLIRAAIAKATGGCSMIPLADLAERWGVSESYLRRLCRAGRLTGAIRKGWSWLVPADIKRPPHRYAGARK